MQIYPRHDSALKKFTEQKWIIFTPQMKIEEGFVVVSGVRCDVLYKLQNAKKMLPKLMSRAELS